MKKGDIFRDLKNRDFIVVSIDREKVVFVVLEKVNARFEPVKREEVDLFFKINLINPAASPMITKNNLFNQLFIFQHFYIPWNISRKPLGKPQPIDEKSYRDFRGYAVPLIRKVFRCNKSKGEGIFDDFYKSYGLPINKNQCLSETISKENI